MNGDPQAQLLVVKVWQLILASLVLVTPPTLAVIAVAWRLGNTLGSLTTNMETVLLKLEEHAAEIRDLYEVKVGKDNCQEYRARIK